MSRIIFAYSAVFLFLAACGFSDYNARVSQLEKRTREFDSELVETENRVHVLSNKWLNIASAYEEIARNYQKARESYNQSQKARFKSAAYYDAASLDWQKAQTNWKLYRLIVEVAVSIDASNYQDSRGAFSCETMSTAAFRALLIANGVDLTGMDIDHIVPRSLGGADHPANYQILPSSLNRSLGAQWDLSKCEMAGLEKCAQAVTVSSRCGSYRGHFF